MKQHLEKDFAQPGNFRLFAPCLHPLIPAPNPDVISVGPWTCGDINQMKKTTLF